MTQLCIKDEKVAQLVTELAKRRGTTKQGAVKMAVRAALDRDKQPVTLTAKLERLRAEQPLPPPPDPTCR